MSICGVPDMSSPSPNSQADDPDQYCADGRGDDDAPAGRVVGRRIEPDTGIPPQMADATEEMEDQRDGPAEQQQQSDRRAHEPLRSIENIVGAGRGDQPPGEQKRTDPQCYTRYTMQDRQGHTDRPAIDL